MKDSKEKLQQPSSSESMVKKLSQLQNELTQAYMAFLNPDTSGRVGPLKLEAEETRARYMQQLRLLLRVETSNGANDLELTFINNVSFLANQVEVIHASITGIHGQYTDKSDDIYAKSVSRYEEYRVEIEERYFDPRIVTEQCLVDVADVVVSHALMDAIKYSDTTQGSAPQPIAA